jgi:uncharacterized protein YlxW (UPF0749 family)
MHEGEIAMFIAVMTIIMAVSVMMLTWMRGRQRLAELQAQTGPTIEAGRKVELLSSENAGLKGQVGRLEERIATLERIVTDPAERTAREIEALRISNN